MNRWMSHSKGFAEAKTGARESNLGHHHQSVPETWRLKGLTQVKRKASCDFKRTTTFEKKLRGYPLVRNMEYKFLKLWITLQKAIKTCAVRVCSSFHRVYTLFPPTQSSSWLAFWWFIKHHINTPGHTASSEILYKEVLPITRKQLCTK